MRERIAHYRLVSQLGAGGMGVVYRAEDERLGRPVALKVLPPNTLADAAVRHRFHQEARTLCRLNHPNIATLYDFGEEGGVDYLVMELIAGTTLQELLTSGPLPVAQIASFGTQLARALAAAHEAGIVHRDLKPGNVMITPEGHVKVLDFGLAKQVVVASAASATVESTSTQGVVGTLPYMAPEQLRGDAPDARIDIYGAGVVLYEMGTARVPFDDRGAMLVDAILNRAPSPPSAHNSSLPRDFDSIVGKTLDKQPSRRYQSARELAVDLERLGTSSAVGTSLASAAPRHTLWKFAAPAAVLLLAAGSWFAFRRPGTKVAPGEIRSLAVLPLENLSGDPQQEYFADGMTEELTSVLAQISSLRVISRTSAMQYKRTTKKVSDVAHELGVDAVIEGSVLRAGDRVRITAQLVNAAEDRHLWAKEYEGDIRDVLKLQGDVAQAVAEQVRAKVNNRTASSVSKAVDPQAYDWYLRGKFHVYRKNREDTTAAIKDFQQAITLDPSFAPAFAWLADCYNTQITLFDPDDKLIEEKAFSSAEKALELDPSLADAHLGLGRILWSPTQHFDHQAAMREYRRAIALNPNLDEAHHQLGLVYLHIGLLDEAMTELRRAVELNPTNQLAYYRVGVALLYMGRAREAYDYFQRVPLEAQPSLVAYQNAWSLSYLGQIDDALALTRAFFIANSRDEGGLVTSTEAILYAKKGDRVRTENAIHSAVARRGRFIHFHHTAYNIASAYAILGDVPLAMKWLRSAAEDGYPCFPLFAQDPHLAKLRSNRDFQAFLAEQKAIWEKNKALAAQPAV